MSLNFIATLLLMLGLALYFLAAVSSIRSALVGAWLALVGSVILVVQMLVGLF